MEKNDNNRRIIIMGAGLAGLAAGYELAKSGRKVTVLEKSESIGGLARTIQVKNFRFDTGPHRWYTKNNSVNKWMLTILGPEVIKVPRLTRIYFDGKFFYYPIKLLNALMGMGPFRAIQSVIDYVFARVRERIFSPKLVTMEDGYISQFGTTLYNTFFKRYSEKLWGCDCREISIDWVGQRTRGLNVSTLIKDTFFKSRGVVSLVDEFSYPEKGIGRLADKLAAEIKRKGGEIICEADVARIHHTDGKITSVSYLKDKKTKTVEAEEFISSIPLDELVRKLLPRQDKKIINLSNKLTYRDELQVALFVKKTHITPDTWIYVHPKNIPYMRVMEMDNWSNKLSPIDTTTLVFEVACNIGDKLWNKSDKEVIELVTRSYVSEFKLIDKNDIIDGVVHRAPKEYPVYHLGYKEDVDLIKAHLNKFPNLQIVGRNGTFRYNNMDHSIEMGLYAGWNIIKGKKVYDIESVNIEREYLEEKKIENIEDYSLEKDG